MLPISWYFYSSCRINVFLFIDMGSPISPSVHLLIMLIILVRFTFWFMIWFSLSGASVWIEHFSQFFLVCVCLPFDLVENVAVPLSLCHDYFWEDFLTFPLAILYSFCKITFVYCRFYANGRHILSAGEDRSFRLFSIIQVSISPQHNILFQGFLLEKCFYGYFFFFYFSYICLLPFFRYDFVFTYCQIQSCWKGRHCESSHLDEWKFVICIFCART